MSNTPHRRHSRPVLLRPLFADHCPAGALRHGLPVLPPANGAALRPHRHSPAIPFWTLTDGNAPHRGSLGAAIDLHFEAIYSGFLGSAASDRHLVAGFSAPLSRHPDTLLVIVDPVMGDHGTAVPNLHAGAVPGYAGAGGKRGCDHPQSDGGGAVCWTVPMRKFQADRRLRRWFAGLSL